MPELREKILNEALQIGPETEWASGLVANNTLNTDHVWDDLEIRQEIVRGLGELAIPLKPKVIVPFPEGANKWGKALGKEIDLPVRYLRCTDKRAGIRAYRFKKPLWPPKPSDVLFLDDVTNLRTTLNGALNMKCIRNREIKVAGFLSIWDRGPEDLQDPVDLAMSHLFKEYIPSQITPDSPFWEFAA